MRLASKRLLGVAALLSVALGVFVLLRLPQPSDQEQILAQIEFARDAAQRHDVAGIMKIVSAHYHGDSDFDSNVDELHFFLGRTIGKSDTAGQVSLSPPAVQVHGTTADSVSQVTANWTGGTYSSLVTLHWQREDGTRWLIFPAKVWRVVGAQYQAPSSGEGGGSLF